MGIAATDVPQSIYAVVDLYGQVERNESSLNV